MKHVFVVHSGITDLIAHAIIANRKLDHRDCLFWRERDFEPSRWPEQYHSYPKDAMWSTEEDWGVASEFLERICGGDKFIIYVPHLWPYNWRRAISLAACVGYYWLEEGSLSYWDHLYGDAYPRSLLAVRFTRHALRSVSSSRQRRNPLSSWDRSRKYRGAYCSSPLAFNGFPNRCVLDGVFIAPADVDHWLGSHIVILPPLTTLQQSEWFGLVKNAMGDRLQRRDCAGYYRFHPDQVRDLVSAAKWRSVFEREWGLKEMASAAQVDSIVHHTSCTVHLCDSSVGIYALTGASRVVCYSNYPTAHTVVGVFRRAGGGVGRTYEEVAG